MDDATTYAQYHQYQRRDVNFVLNEYLQRVNGNTFANNDATVLDVGCGCGDTTAYLLTRLQEKMSRKIAKIIGMDSSLDMIRHAANRHRNGCLEFRHTDIVTLPRNDTLNGTIDCIFSFYCLHWIQNQRKAFGNMHRLLVTNGQMLVAFLASNPVFDVYLTMAKNMRWRKYMLDVNEYISPYHNIVNVEEKLKRTLEDIGFVVNECRIHSRRYTFEDLKAWRNTIKAVNPFIKRLPKDAVDDYLDDMLKEVANLGSLIVSETKTHVSFTYDLFVVQARKAKGI